MEVTKTSQASIVFQRFLKRSTFHGLPRTSKRYHWLLRILWSLLFLAATTASVIQIVLVVSRYLSEPVNKEITIVYEPVQFPAVTFCNLNNMRNSKLDLGGEELLGVIREIEKTQAQANTGSSTSERRKRHTSKKSQIENHKGDNNDVPSKSNRINLVKEKTYMLESRAMGHGTNSHQKRSDYFEQFRISDWDAGDFGLGDVRTIKHNHDLVDIVSMRQHKIVQTHGYIPAKLDHSTMTWLKIIRDKLDHSGNHSSQNCVIENKKGDTEHLPSTLLELENIENTHHRVKRAKGGVSPSCDGSATSPSGIFYCAMYSPLSWADAKAWCESSNLGPSSMTLAIVDNQAEFEWLATSSIWCCTSTASFWLGITRRTTSSPYWYWLNGALHDYGFRSDEPDAGDEHCGTSGQGAVGMTVACGTSANSVYFACSTYDTSVGLEYPVPFGPETTTVPDTTTVPTTEFLTSTLALTTSLEITSTQQPTTTLAPSSTEQPTTTEEITNTRQPTTTFAPSSTEQPTTTADITTTQQPTTTIAPSSTEQPTTTNEITTSHQPIITFAQSSTEQSTTTKEITTTQQPTTFALSSTEQPTTTKEITTTQKPTSFAHSSTEQPTTTKEITTTQQPISLTMIETTTSMTQDPTSTFIYSSTQQPTTTVKPTITTTIAVQELTIAKIESTTPGPTTKTTLVIDTTPSPDQTSIQYTTPSSHIPSIEQSTISLPSTSSLQTTSLSPTTKVNAKSTQHHTSTAVPMSTVKVNTVDQTKISTSPLRASTTDTTFSVTSSLKPLTTFLDKTTTPFFIFTTGVLEPTPPSEVPTDRADEPFIPDVDLSTKPWFKPDEVVVDVAVESLKNVTRALASVPLETKRVMGHQIDDMLLECMWNGKTCTPLEFDGFVSKFYGNCYTFNSGEYRNISWAEKSGSHFGLKITLFAEQDEYVAALSSSAGFRVIVHRQDQQAFPEDEGFDISPGTKTAVKLRLVKYELYEPFRNCTQDDKPTLYKKNYSIRACQKTCLQNVKKRECGCVDAALPNPQNEKICSAEEKACSDLQDENLFTGIIMCDCLELCRDRTYGQSISVSKWPGQAYEKVIRETFATRNGKLASTLSTSDGMRKNLLRLEVHFDEIKFEQVVEIPSYDFNQLLSDIGGALGLWIGISAITIAEVIQLFMDLLFLAAGKPINIEKSNQENQNSDVSLSDVDLHNALDTPTPPVTTSMLQTHKGMTPVENWLNLEMNSMAKSHVERWLEDEELKNTSASTPTKKKKKSKRPSSTEM